MIEARAYARVGLLGNPSDGYGGRVLAFTIEDFAATVALTAADGIALTSPGAAPLVADSWRALTTDIDPRALDGAQALIVAAARQLAAHLRAYGRADERAVGFSLSWRSTIPRESGLSGSSAIVIASLRAFACALGAHVPAEVMAVLALAAERDELGIAAGPQDRVIQAHEGFLDMDFSGPPGQVRTTRLDPGLLPPLYLAWTSQPGERSGIAHDDIRARWEAGDPAVQRAMARFPRIAAAGRACLERGDVVGLGACVDENFDTRAAIWPLRASDRQLVKTGRAAGAAVKFCGSGGSVVGVLRPDTELAAVEAAHRAAGHRVLVPRIRAGHDGP